MQHRLLSQISKAIVGITVIENLVNNEVSVWNVTVLNGDFFVGKKWEEVREGMVLWEITELKGPLDAYGVFYHGFPHFLFCRIRLFCDSIFSGGYTDYFSKTSYKVGIIIKTGTIAGISDS